MTNHIKFTLSLYKTCPFDLVHSSEYRIERRYSCLNCGPCYSWHPATAQSNSLIWHRFPLQDQPNTLLTQTSFHRKCGLNRVVNTTRSGRHFRIFRRNISTKLQRVTSNKQALRKTLAIASRNTLFPWNNRRP